MLNKFKIGHYTDNVNGTGATVIIAEQGAVGGVSVRGAAPATRETDLLKNDKTVQKVNAVVLSGGSAFGLECACGVMEYLHQKGCGYNAGAFTVPIVCGASIYDLEYKNFAYPTKQNGYDAAANAKEDNFESGNIGVGSGSTASKMLGIAAAVKTGLGVATYKLNGLEIAIIVGVNPLGDIVNNGAIIAGAQAEDGSFADCQKIITAGSLPLKNSNTTIGVIITNAKLTKVEANILADIAHDGYALAISPSHTRFDGDAMFCLASGDKNVDINILTGIIPALTAQAIKSSVVDIAPINKRISPLLFKVMQKMFK